MGDSLHGSVVLISGASSGIGASIALEFSKWKVKLALTGRDAKRLKSTADQCKEGGLSEQDIFLITGDVTVKDDVEKIVNKTVEHFGKLDILVNNAGATRARNIDNCTIEDLDWVYNVLVRSVFMMTKAAIPHLEKTKGAIIMVSSLAGLRPLHYAVPYSMCKGMVDRFAQILSTAVGGRGIRVNCVNPATMKTKLFSTGVCAGDPRKLQKYLSRIQDSIPLGRLGEIDEVARLVAFLSSKEASYMNGIQFPIDGGLHNTCYHPPAE